jgi:hypothetical protein
LVLPKQQPVAPTKAFLAQRAAGFFGLSGKSQQEATMPLIQGGPPEWIWERTPERLKWEIDSSDRPDGQTLYELRVQCGLEIMRLQFFSARKSSTWPRCWPNTARSGQAV